MRYPASEKLEIIRLVERSHLTGPADVGQAGHPEHHVLPVVRRMISVNKGGQIGTLN
jgi:hypothetical protein